MWPPSVLAHVLPVEHGAGGDATLTFTLLTFGVLASALAGIVLANQLTQRIRASLLSAVSVGILLFLLYDLLKETASLGQGLLGAPVLMLGILASFAAGTLVLPLFARGEQGAWLAYAWALGIGMHSLGEGYTLGTEAATANLGSITGIASFLLHKGMEAFTIPILMGAKMGKRSTLLVAGGIASATLMGAFMGIVLGATTLPLLFFAAGAGAVAIAITRLARATEPDARHAIVTLAGVLLVFAAGLLHEI